MKLVLVSPRSGNRYMREILEAIAHEATGLGVSALVVDDVFPEDDDAVFVVIPHEYFALAPRSHWPSERLLGRTFALTVEHPGTPWFEISAEQARRCAAIIDINNDSTLELRRRGLDAVHFQLGYTEYVDHWHGGAGRGGAEQRGVDVLYLGSTDEKRDRALAGAAPFWWDRSTRLLIPTQLPKPDGESDFLVGAEKYELLRDSRILVNLHRDRSRSLEWVRVLEAVANGCVVVSEHSVDAAPLVSQEHFLSVSAENIGILTANVLDNEAELDRLRHNAYEFVRSSLRLSTAVEILLAEGEALLREPRPVPASDSVTRLPDFEPPPPRWRAFEGPRDPMVEAVTRLETQVARLSRALVLAQSGSAQSEPLRTPAYAAASPRVSVIVPVHNAAPWIAEALDSLMAGSYRDLEILLLDDASQDASPTVVEAYLAAHPDVPMSFTRSSVNRRPAATRNALLDQARGEFVFTLDADNGVYPTALARLVAALDADPGAVFAYAIIAAFRSGEPAALVSSRPWNPNLFRYGNYIDNMALLRTATLRSLGGWDASIANWEDFHLWVRYAEAGHRAAFVPSILSWYRLSPYSMRTEVALTEPVVWAQLRASAPTVLSDGLLA